MSEKGREDKGREGKEDRGTCSTAFAAQDCLLMIRPPVPYRKRGGRFLRKMQLYYS